MSDPQIERARLRTIRAKAQLGEDLGELKDRLLPRRLAKRLAHLTKDKAVDAAAAGAGAVKARPAIAAGIAALTALFLARKPIIRAISPHDAETEPRAARSAD